MLYLCHCYHTAEFFPPPLASDLFLSPLLPRKHKHNCYCAQEVLSGLRQPVAVVHCGDGSQRLFVLEREGIVRILNHDLELIKEPFLDIHKLVQSGLKVGVSC